VTLIKIQQFLLQSKGEISHAVVIQCRPNIIILIFQHYFILI